MGPSTLRATVGIVGPETLFGWIGVCAGWVGRTAAGGGTCTWVRRWRTCWSTWRGGVDGRGGALPGRLFCMNIYVEPMKSLLGKSYCLKEVCARCGLRSF